MNISARLAGTSDLARFDPVRLIERLRADLERELQATLPADRAHDSATRRAALEDAIARLKSSVVSREW